MKKIKIATFVLLFFTTLVNAQLSDFSFSVTKTNETCLGNGSLTFSVSNTTPNAAMLFKVYKLPNATTPVAVLTATYLGSLGAATYKVVAMQSLGSMLNTKEQTVTIDSQIVPLDFILTSTNQSCSAGGSIIVQTLSGTFASCEIIGGPVIRQLQSSNVFDGLVGGTYKVRVFDSCGVAKVKTYTLSLITAVLNISDTAYPNIISPLCDSITVSNTITPTAGSINYPLTIKHTLSTMTIGGDNVEINQVISSGSATSLVVTAVMPRYPNVTYDLSVIDYCNTPYQKSCTVDPNIYVGLSTGQAPCANKFLKLSALRYTGSYTVTFLSAPAGFDPANFNATPAGPFTDPNVTYGSATNTVPFGNYTVQITDSCGRTATQSILVEFVKPSPSIGAYNNGCFSLFGRINLSVPSQHIVSAVITAAPANYPAAIPQDVTSLISPQGELNLYNLPLGTYTISFTDDCGFVYEKTATVPPFVEQDFFLVTLPACDAGFGTVRYQSGNGDLTSVQVTAAPAAFNHTLPYDVSVNIDAAGDFYMAGLPEGTYSFTATDVCGIVKEKTINVEGYIPPQNSFVYTPNCGSFAVKVTDNSNGSEGASYWLQKYFPATGTWGNPVNAVVYPEGTVPTTDNSIKLANNTFKNNLNFTGKFRIIKKFETFTTGSVVNTVCISELGEFNYADGLSINTAYSLACVGSPNDVMLEVTGQPTSFKIIEKNGQPYTFDNGTNNVFVNIDPAEYVFQIEDDCGNIVTQWFNVQTLPSIADATQPNDMVICVEPGTAATYQYHLPNQDSAILGPLYSATYTITYHLTFEDADNGVNPLPADYTSTGNGQTIYARLVHNEISLCHGVTSFKLYVGEYQEPVITTQGTICNDGSLTLTANGGYSSYLWSTGETTQTIHVTEPGLYTVVVEKSYGTAVCDGFADVEIKESVTPVIKKIETADWTEDQNMITVKATGAADLLYSIDGVNYQTDNVFTGLETGLYNVYVKDAHGCGLDTKEVVLLNYPNYFTPNGDGTHDTWYIRYAVKEPHMNVTIMDRYGKIITTFGSTSRGWDGTLNGIQLPSTDYWFVVTREDGRELRGHFAMLR